VGVVRQSVASLYARTGTWKAATCAVDGPRRRRSIASELTVDGDRLVRRARHGLFSGWHAPVGWLARRRLRSPECCQSVAVPCRSGLCGWRRRRLLCLLCSLSSVLPIGLDLPRSEVVASPGADCRCANLSCFALKATRDLPCLAVIDHLLRTTFHVLQELFL
jgi:hypothetical protein